VVKNFYLTILYVVTTTASCYVSALAVVDGGKKLETYSDDKIIVISHNAATGEHGGTSFP